MTHQTSSALGKGGVLQAATGAHSQLWWWGQWTSGVTTVCKLVQEHGCERTRMGPTLFPLPPLKTVGQMSHSTVLCAAQQWCHCIHSCTQDREQAHSGCEWWHRCFSFSCWLQDIFSQQASQGQGLGKCNHSGRDATFQTEQFLGVTV